MFGLIKSIFSSINTLKINPDNQKQLQKKLHNIAQQILNVQKPFDCWMQFQTQNSLHTTLQSIYNQFVSEYPSEKYSENEIALIYQFYTLLLKNCNDQLLVCKLVSDEFVINLGKMMKMSEDSKEELEAYRINLIKAYLSRVNYEIVKYMVIQDQFKIFCECVSIFKGKTGTIEQTTIANSILNLIKQVDMFEFLYESIWVECGLKGLFNETLRLISEQINLQFPQSLNEHILFLIQIRRSTHKPSIHADIDKYCEPKLAQILFKIEQLQRREMINCCADIFVLFETFKMLNPLIKILLSRLPSIIDITRSQTKPDNLQITNFTIKAIFLLCKIICSEQSLISYRLTEQLQTPIKQQINHYRLKLIQFYRFFLKYHQTMIPNAQKKSRTLICQIKFVMLSIFKIKMTVNQSTEDTLAKECQEIQIDILGYFLEYIGQVQKILKNNALWNQLIRWYEEATNKVVVDLLELSDFVQIKNQDPIQAVLLGFQYLRNYRFMIVKQTSLNPKNIKQDKSYSLTFQSPGLYFQPGCVLPEDTPLKIVCRCLLNHNLQQIPVVIIEDKQCFIIGMKTDSNETKIIINLKFKDIINFVYSSQRNMEEKKQQRDPKFIRINLKGMQQINLQFSNPQITGNLFKDYLIQSKDMNRQKQLVFLNNWIKQYNEDSYKSLECLKEAIKDTKEDKTQQMKNEEPLLKQIKEEKKQLVSNLVRQQEQNVLNGEK